MLTACVCVCVYVCIISRRRRPKRQSGGTHYRAWPLAKRTQGNAAVLLESSPPPVGLSQGQEHVHGATGIGVHLAEGGRGLGQEVMELPVKTHTVTQKSRTHDADE